MDAFDCIVGRRSIRAFKEDEVPDDNLKKILEAGRWAPSAMNKQPWEFITIHDESTLSEIAEHARYGSFIAEAPVAVAVVTDPSTKWHEIDGSGAVENMSLAAWNMGIGSCWIGSLDREKVKAILGIPNERHLLTVMPFGYPAKVGSSTRKDLDTIIHDESW
jgi:nitroreductase